jgi:TrpR family transcriptional regulator, trp operon repressor
MKYLNNLIETLLEIKDKKLLIDFLEGILTPKELEEIPIRLEIIKRLKKGEAQHKIAKDLGLGVATVTRGSRELKLGRFKAVK